LAINIHRVICHSFVSANRQILLLTKIKTWTGFPKRDGVCNPVPHVLRHPNQRAIIAKNSRVYFFSAEFSFMLLKPTANIWDGVTIPVPRGSKSLETRSDKLL